MVYPFMDSVHAFLRIPAARIFQINNILSDFIHFDFYRIRFKKNYWFGEHTTLSRKTTT